MSACKVLEKSMLGDAVEVNAREDARGFPGSGSFSFEAARKIADAEAKKRSPEPMLLAWYDKKTGDFSPRVQ